MTNTRRKEAVGKKRSICIGNYFSLLLSTVSFTMQTSFKPCIEVFGCPQVEKIPFYCQRYTNNKQFEYAVN